MMAWRLLGSHKLAVALLIVLAVAAVLGGTLPQSVRLTSEDQQGWQQEWGSSTGWLEILHLSGIYGSPWFWGLCLLLLLNLSAGTLQLIMRHRPWRQFHTWGVVLGHTGLLLIVAGAMGSALSGFGGYLELTEREVWQGEANKLNIDRGRFPGFEAVLRLDRVIAELGAASNLQTLHLLLSWQEESGTPQHGAISTNQPIGVAGYRIYPGNTFGYSAALERHLPSGERRLLLVNFPVPRDQWGSAQWQAEQSRAIHVGYEIRHFRLRLEGEPARLHMLVRRGAEQLYEGWLVPGDSIEVGGEQMILRVVAPWAGLYLAADRGAPWVFAGMLLAVAGFLLHLAWPRRRNREQAA